MLRMELAEGCVVEFMATHFEVPLLAVQGICRVIVEPADCLDNWGGTAHWRGKPDWVSADDLRPSLM